MRIVPIKISNLNFSKFGSIVSIQNKKPKIINKGFALNYSNLVNLNVLQKSGKPRLNIFKAKPRKFPLSIDMMEKHPLGSQLFFPLTNCSFIVLVAPPGPFPEINKIKSFIVKPNIGINYKAGVWHYPLIVLKKSIFIVLDRQGNNKNLNIYKFKNQSIKLYYE